MEGNGEISVLLLEDNPTLRGSICHYLSSEGLRVRSAASSQEFIELLSQEESQILIMDVLLPGEDAFAVLEGLSGSGRHGIIMLTILGELDDKIKGLEGGADIYLVKPVDNRELLACIHSLHRSLQQVIGVNGSSGKAYGKST